MSDDNTAGYAGFLHAKHALDERSLNERVWRRVMGHASTLPDTPPLRILELGAGVGGTLERLLESGCRQSLHYTVVDVEAAHVRAFHAGLQHRASNLGLALRLVDPTRLVLEREGQTVEVTLLHDDVASFIAVQGPTYRCDLLVAQAFLDLFDIEALLPALAPLVRDTGAMYFPITFDGVSAWMPALDPGLDAEIERLYHRSMDARSPQWGCRPGAVPRSQTGRHVLGVLYEAGWRDFEVGGSDWVVHAGPDGCYPEGEAAFLYMLLDGYEAVLSKSMHHDPSALRGWLAARRTHIEHGHAVFMTHQLDVFAKRRA